MNYKMKYNKDALFMHRFAMKEELGELIFEVLFFVYVKSIRNDELDTMDNTINFNTYYFLLCTILYLFSMISVS